MDVIAIVGSLRVGSVNAAAARAAIEHAPGGMQIKIDDVADVPLYNGDVEVEGVPAEVESLIDRVAISDGVIFFTPEYNSSLPAVTKNVIDWLSRPPRRYEGTPVTIVATTPGGRAGAGVRSHFVDIMEHQPIRLFDETHGIGQYREKFDENVLTDPDAIVELRAFLGRFADFIESSPAG
ncbi:MAG: NADPH-dependent FMN reductase [Acidimicrobiales bacterium]